MAIFTFDTLPVFLVFPIVPGHFFSIFFRLSTRLVALLLCPLSGIVLHPDHLLEEQDEVRVSCQDGKCEAQEHLSQGFIGGRAVCRGSVGFSEEHGGGKDYTGLFSFVMLSDTLLVVHIVVPPANYQSVIQQPKVLLPTMWPLHPS